MDSVIHPFYVEQILAKWHGLPKERAYSFIRKHQLPNEATISRLIWYNNWPWKCTILYRTTVPHNFPLPHVDFLEQTIDYRTPLGLYDEIAKYDGSVYLDRTKGEASAKCDSEEMNFLALNLFNDIVTGKRTVDEAKWFYAETAARFKKYNLEIGKYVDFSTRIKLYLQEKVMQKVFSRMFPLIIKISGIPTC